MKRTFSGHDELTGMMNSLLWFAGTSVALVASILNGGTYWAAVWFIGALLTPVIWFGARYRLTVGDDGVVLKKFWLWPLGRSKRYYLDCAAGLYESWESDRPEGLFLDTGSLLEDSDVLGPYFDTLAMATLAAEVNDAITAARTRAFHARDVDVPGVESDAFGVLERALGGPPKLVQTRRPVRFRGVRIPAGSTWRLNREGWVDPARHDDVREIELCEAATLPNGVVAPAGATLSFRAHAPEKITVRGTEELRFGDIHVRTEGESVTFDDGELTDYTLAAPLVRGGVTIPAGSSLDRQSKYDDHAWFVRLGGPTSVGNIELRADEYIWFDRRWRPESVSLNRDEVVVDRVTLRGHLSALPVKSGRLDLRECRRRGLVSATWRERAGDLLVSGLECLRFYLLLTFAVSAAACALVLVLELLGI